MLSFYPMSARQLIRVFLFLFILSGEHTVYSQISVKGSVRDNNNIPLPFPTILVTSLPDSTILKSAIGDSAGLYSLACEGKYPVLLTVSVSGYMTAYRQIQPTTGPMHEQNFALPSLSRTLKGVVVTTRKPLIERKADRTIFNVESSVVSVGGDALDVVGKAPGVRVTNSDISITGKSSVNVTATFVKVRRQKSRIATSTDR